LRNSRRVARRLGLLPHPAPLIQETLMKRMISWCALAAASVGVARAESPAARALVGRPEPAKSATADKIKGLQDGVAVDRTPARMLGGLRTSFDPKAGAQLGLRDRADAQATEVGAPMRMVFVDAGNLKAYAGGSPDPLLREVPLVTRLVRVQGQARSMLLQSNAGGTWQTVQMGDARRAVAIEQVSRALTSGQGVAEADL